MTHKHAHAPPLPPIDVKHATAEAMHDSMRMRRGVAGAHTHHSLPPSPSTHTTTGHTSVVAVDEADKLLSPGLAPQLDRLRDLLLGGARPSARTVILTSATMPAAVDGAAAGWLTPDRVEVVVKEEAEEGKEAVAGDDPAALLPTTAMLPPPPPRPVITQAVHVCAVHKKAGKLLKHLAAINLASTAARHRPRVAVFVNRIATASAVASAVGAAGHKVALLHGGRPQAARDAALAAFRAGAATVLVATDVAARGLHIPTLRHVVNYDFPPNLETYTHRVGRVGRLEDGGHAFSFFTRPLAPLARPLLALLDAAGSAVDPNLVRLADAYDEARARLAMLPDVAGGGVIEDAARAARRAAVGQVLAEAAGDGMKHKKKKRQKKTEVEVDEEEEEEEEVPSDDDSDEEGGISFSDDGEDGAAAAAAAPLRKRKKARPLAKADLPGLYKSSRKPLACADGDAADDDDDRVGPTAWAVVAEEEAPADPSNKRRKALPGRLRKKQAAERAKKNQNRVGG